MKNPELTIKLVLAKVEILKMKSANGGYDWSFVNKQDAEQVDKALVEIDAILTQENADVETLAKNVVKEADQNSPAHNKLTVIESSFAEKWFAIGYEQAKYNLGKTTK